MARAGRILVEHRPPWPFLARGGGGRGVVSGGGGGRRRREQRRLEAPENLPAAGRASVRLRGGGVPSGLRLQYQNRTPFLIFLHWNYVIRCPVGREMGGGTDVGAAEDAAHGAEACAVEGEAHVRDERRGPAARTALDQRARIYIYIILTVKERG